MHSGARNPPRAPSLTDEQHDHIQHMLDGDTSTANVMANMADDMLVTCSNLGLIEHTKAILHKAFKIKDLGELKFFLGMEFSRSAKGILMNQRKYALEIISDLGLGNAKPTWTPLEANVRLTIQELDHLTGEVGDELFEDKE
uniref:Reverse transcriptase Ty1/copia-type domain-containing protein n=1 Tax=Solanum lycopersicum TaxID=4081 RepID=A0A3Q7I7P1_SOLLC